MKLGLTVEQWIYLLQRIKDSKDNLYSFLICVQTFPFDNGFSIEIDIHACYEELILCKENDFSFDVVIDKFIKRLERCL